MLNQFKEFIAKKHLIKPKSTVLLAVSGGLDSVVMTQLIHEAGYNCAIAHCNFGLRGKESEADVAFVKNLAKQLGIPFFSKKFNTQKYAAEKNVSTQMAARDLRYNWFEELCEANNFDNIAVAHHQDDVLETVLINLVRGTGIRGLQGIPVKRGRVIRPLLFATRDQIATYAKKHKLKYREDSSNASDKYMRNKLRHHIVPVLRELNPALHTTIAHLTDYLNQSEQLINKAVQDFKNAVWTSEGEIHTLNIKELQNFSPLPAYLYETLAPFGFTGIVLDELIKAIANKNNSGKHFFSASHKLLINRDELILLPIMSANEPKADTISLAISVVKATGFKIPTDKKTACFDFDLLQFPLTLRKWKEGDFFYPLGMNKKKKLSDFFIDNKFSLKDKEDAWFLCSGDAIVWIVGNRMDDRFKIGKSTNKILKLELK